MKYLLALSFLLAIPAFSEEPKKEAAVVVAVPSPTPSIVQEMINEPATEPALDPVFVPPTWLQEVVLFIKNHFQSRRAGRPTRQYICPTAVNLALT